MNGYTQGIEDLLRCTEKEAVIIEDLMRSQVFHSTLDWVSERQFNKGAREAQRTLGGGGRGHRASGDV